MYQRSDGRWVGAVTIGGTRGFQKRKSVYGQFLDQWISYLELAPSLEYEIGSGIPRLSLTQGSVLQSVVALTMFALTGTRAFQRAQIAGVLSSRADFLEVASVATVRVVVRRLRNEMPH